MKIPGYAIVTLALFSSTICFSQSEKGQTVEQLVDLLTGEFDSFKQRQDDRYNKVNKDQAHGWVNRAFIRVDAPKVGDIVLVGSTNYNGPLGIVDKNEFLVWTFENSLKEGQITMSPRRFKKLEARLAFARDADKLAGFSVEDLEDAISGAACDIGWVKSTNGFYGKSEACQIMSTTHNKMLVWNWSYHLDPDGISIAFSGTDDTGEVLDGTPTDKPYRLDRLASNARFQQGQELLFNAYEQADYASSQALLEAAVKREPKNAAAIVALIYAYIKGNRYSDAEQYLSAALALKNKLSRSEASRLAGLQARIADDYEQEINAWTKLTKLDQNDRWAWYELASIYYRSELYQQAADAIKGALTAEPDESKWGASYIYYLHSKSLYRIGKFAESVAAAEPGVRNKKTQRATFYRKIIAQIANGEISDPSGALAHYRDLSTQDGKINEAVLQTNIALMFFELGDYATAIKHGQAGYQLSQKPYHAWALAYSLTENGSLDRALEILTTANTEHPDNVNVLAGLGWAHYRLGQLQPALEFLLAAQEASPRKNSGVERDLKIVKSAMSNSNTKQVAPVRWFGD